jgi:hypothetical protein
MMDDPPNWKRPNSSPFKILLPGVCHLLWKLYMFVSACFQYDICSNHLLDGTHISSTYRHKEHFAKLLRVDNGIVSRIPR